MSLNISLNQPLHHFDIDISFKVNSNGIIGLFGPSGSGKTSILRAIAGLNQHTQGTISFNEYQWNIPYKKSEKTKPDIGMVFQDSRLFEHLTVDKNITITSKLSKESLSSLVKEFDISPLLEKHAYQLSAGQKQRVALVRSLAAAPQLLLLDEPLSALDNKAKKALINTLKRYSQQHNLPMIYVSHHVEEINGLCDQLILIEQGKLIDCGDCQTILKQHHLLATQADVIHCDHNKKQITLQLSDENFKLISKSSYLKLTD